MTRTTRVWCWLFTMALAGILLGGCTRAVRPEHFYTLSAMEALSGVPGTDSPSGRTPKIIGVGPVRLPEAIDRPQIVTRATPNRLDISEYHLWAGALDREITRVVVENIGYLLGTDQVVSFPWEPFDAPTLRVNLDVRRFDGLPGQEAILDVAWTIVTRRPATLLHRQQSRLREAVSQDSFESLVAAQSRLLAALSRQIAAALQRIDPGDESVGRQSR